MATDSALEGAVPGRQRSVYGVGLMFVVAGALAAMVFLSLPGEALLGFDAYPLIAAARMDGIGDVLTPFTRELMDGRYPDGRFYRPLVHASFALDDIAGGRSLGPRWFRVTDIAVAAAAAALLGAIASRLVRLRGSDGVTAAGLCAGVAAILIYLLHAAQLEVVPFAPRRADALATLFVAGAVLAALRGERPWVLGLLTLAALFSKESGVIALPLIFVASLVRPNDNGVRDAALACLAPGAALAVGIVCRFAVLGELGGHAESGVGEATGTALSTAIDAWRLLVSGAPGGGVAIGLALGLLVVAVALVHPRAALIAGSWALLALAITAVAGRMHAWYVITFLPPIAVLAGVAVGSLCVHRNALALIGSGGAIALLGLFGAASFGGDQRETLRVASAIAADQVTRFRAEVRELADGDAGTFSPWVFSVGSAPGEPPVFLHAHYSLQALADLVRPELDVEVLLPGERATGTPRTSITLIPGPPPESAIPR